MQTFLLQENLKTSWELKNQQRMTLTEITSPRSQNLLLKTSITRSRHPYQSLRRNPSQKLFLKVRSSFVCLLIRKLKINATLSQITGYKSKSYGRKPLTTISVAYASLKNKFSRGGGGGQLVTSMKQILELLYQLIYDGLFCFSDQDLSAS